MANKIKIFIILVILLVFIVGELKSKQLSEQNEKIFVRDLHICKEVGEPIDSSKYLRTIEKIKGQQYFICGYINTERSIRLSIYIFNAESNKLVFSNPIHETFIQGNFYSNFNINNLETGDYYIEVYRGRVLLSNFYFSIIE